MRCDRIESARELALRKFNRTEFVRKVCTKKERKKFLHYVRGFYEKVNLVQRGIDRGRITRSFWENIETGI